MSVSVSGSVSGIKDVTIATSGNKNPAAYHVENESRYSCNYCAMLLIDALGLSDCFL